MTSLRSRLFVFIGLIVVLTIGVTAAIALALARTSVEHANLDDLSHQADLLAQRERAALLPLAHLASLQPFLAKQQERVEVVDLAKPSPYLADAARAALRRGEPVQGAEHVDRTRTLYAARLVAGKGFVLLRPAKADVSPYGRGLLLAALIGGALAALASFVLARAIARPVRRVAEASRSLAGGESPEPLPEEGSAELRALARSFNEMAADLQQAREAERTFLLSVSHELKTPLTAIRGFAEALAEGAVSLEEALPPIRRETDRLERLVRDLLELARLNRRGFAVERAAVDLGAVAGEAVRRFAGDAAAVGVTLEAVAAGPAPAVADHDRTLQVVSNLVENALRSTPPGGSVRVRAEPGRIAVEDTGLGLPAEDLPRAFERFYLYDRHGAGQRLGTGLGLAIVKELAEAMGGTVTVTSAVGAGSTFVVTLPGGALPAAVGEPVGAS